MTAETLSRRERKKREKRARIVAAARRLFAERGFTATTTRMISDAAGIGTGTLFSYFPDKETLLVHLFVTEIQAVADEAFASLDPEAPVLDQLVHVFSRLLAYYAEDPALSRTIVKEITFFPTRVDRSLDHTNLRFVQNLAQRIEAARPDGFAGPPAVLVASSCFAHYFMTLLSWLSGLAPLGSCEAMLRQLLQLSLSQEPSP